MTRAERIKAWANSPAAGWWGPVGVGLVALVLRLWNLGQPRRLIFDETYYAKEGYGLWQWGYARRGVEDANDLIIASRIPEAFTEEPVQIMHPEAGKWLIGGGIELFGMNPFGWRVAAALAGALTVVLLARLVFNLTGSAVIGSLAGLWLAVDGLHFTMSRIAMLDVFLTLWVVAGLGCLVADRKRIAPGTPPGRVRPWQLTAGLCFGLAIATKWSGGYMLAAFGLAFVIWEVGLRTDLRGRWVTRLLRIGLPAFARIVGVAAIAYMLTWSGWLANAEAYEERYGNTETWGEYLDADERHTGQSLRSLWNYHHHQMWAFHTGDYIAEQEHSYQSHPIRWPLMLRPVSAYAEFGQSASLCDAPAESECVQHISLVGNPIIWWTGAGALVVALGLWVWTRRWIWGVPVVGFAASWLPWFASADRPIFSFYAVTMVPFTVVAIALLADEAWRLVRGGGWRSRAAVTTALSVFTVAAVVMFVYLWPVLTGELVPRDTWFARMLLPSWV